MKEREEVNGTEQISSGGKESNNVEETKDDEATKEIEKQEKIEDDPAENEEVKKEEVVSEDNNEIEADQIVSEDKKEEDKVDEEDSKTEKEKGEVDEVVVDKKESLIEDKEDSNDEEEDEEHHEDELAHENFEKYTKAQLVDLVKTLSKHTDILYADRYLHKVESLFEEIKNAEIEEAKAKFIEEGGDDDGFSFKPDELINRFEANSRLIKDRKHNFLKDRESQRQTNLKRAEETLEMLRVFVDSEESSSSFNKFKEIQSEWKAIGDIPGQHSKTLWANYNALVSRFYDQRSIYFELKELDRKKNYEYKLQLCERAEQLENFENLKEAISVLNELHEEYKHIGPVPEDLQEDLWIRFKGASDKVYQRRKEFVSELKSELQENLVKKEELVEEMKAFLEFDSDRIKAWNAKTKDVIALQKKWEAIGGVPRDKSKDINRAFWSNFKSFFHNKGRFFKKLDEQRSGNYEAKLKLVEKAEALKESTDWIKTANEFKRLQQEWKSIGPVPEKVRSEVYEKFKTAADFFFENKRANVKDEEKNFKENLKVKKEIIQQIEEWSSKADEHIEDLKEKSIEFANAGFVPRKDISSVKTKFAEALNAFMKGLSISDEEKSSLRLEVELGDILVSRNSDKVLYHKEQNIRKQIHQIENDVALWKNNMEFFAHSKTADNLRDEVNEKIEKAETKIASLKGQLRVLRSV